MEVNHMKDRIRDLRKNHLKLTQQAFADKVGLSQNFVWQIEKGERTPSDRTISDICRIFGINEDWLRYGLEPMRLERSKEEEIGEMVASALGGDANFTQAVVKMICSRTPEELKVLEKALSDIYENIKKE
jgi:transcriptional regulator with XRE-family HTH domain